MNRPRQLLPACALALCVLPLCAPGAAFAQASSQDDKWGKPVDLKQLIPVPPILPVPRNYELNSSTLGGTQMPATTSPLGSTGSPSTPPAAGFKFSIPTR